ncbi:hypothetical protein Cs7R123_04240 [Catellatospora sp. TT07R-123]|nr:hypothetical protein Cs7R123_04240 [Catellatospora sp. TT07R-123]
MANDMAVPGDRPTAELVAELSGMLRAADPAIRDRTAYSVVATWIGRGDLDAHLVALGDEMAARFADPEIQARTFAPLILDSIVSRGVFAPSWLAAFTAWYADERDIRGYDPQLGWLHAVAHGADLLGAFGLAPQVGPAELAGLLALGARRMLAPTDHLFAAWEDDRLADALARVLTRAELDQAQALGWLDLIVEELRAAGRPVPVPARTVNTMHTLRMLYVLVDRGRRGWNPADPAEVARVRHRDALLRRLAEVLRLSVQGIG